MRKLSKKISMLMVLAMLVGLFSGVVSASAASAWSFASSKYDVAVNGTVNMESKEYADFDLLKDGAAPAGYTVAWASSDEDVVWVNAKTGQLRANKFGKAADGDKAVISATFTNNATKKSATRSFTIVLGAAKADFTVEAADATIALGEEVKFAPVVKNADGKAVKFATHKSYNGYFLDGKAIANPWTPEEAGEYTVTVAQFAKKADVADLAKAVRKDEVKVTVTVDADFDAKATKVKEITVYGDFAKDATFTVKKDGVQKYTNTATVAEDGKSAVLKLTNKLTKGTYTVTCGDNSATFTAEDEKVASIIISENGGQVYTNVTKTQAYAHYDVLNQYGESIRKTCTVDFTSSASSTLRPSGNTSTGIVTIPASPALVYGNTVVLTAVVSNYNNSALSATATMTVGLEDSIDSIKAIGVVLGNSTEVLDAIPASFVGGDYYLVFECYNRAGYLKPFSATSAAADLTFTSVSPLLIKNVVKTNGLGAMETVFINGVEYGKVKLVKSDVDQLKQGGVATIQVTSNKTGTTTPVTVKINSEQILQSFTIIRPDDVIPQTDPKGDNNTVTLGYEALDAEGNAITDFRALYKAVSFSDPRVVMVENNDGTARLELRLDATTAPSKYVDIPVVFSAIVTGTGKTDNITLYVKEARQAEYVASYAGTNEVLEGDTLYATIRDFWIADKDGAFNFNDQYDTKIEDNDVFGDRQVAVKAIGVTPTEVSITGYDSTMVVGTDTYYMFNAAAGKTLGLAAASNVTPSEKDFVLEVSLYDVSDAAFVSGSEMKFAFKVVDLSKVVSYKVFASNGQLYYGDTRSYSDALANGDPFGEKDTATTFRVEGYLANGHKVNVPDYQGGVAGTAMIEYSAAAYYGSDNLVSSVSAVTAASLVLDASNVNPILSNTNDVFKDYSNVGAEGNEAGRRVNVGVDAKISVCNGLGGTQYLAKTSTSVEVGADGLLINTLEAASWQLQWYQKWVTVGEEAIIQANAGKITFDDLVNFIGDVADNYGSKQGNNAGVKLTLTNIVEGDKGLEKDALVIKKVESSTAGDLLLDKVEIGDTFVVTYGHTAGNGWPASMTVKFTVGADRTAAFSITNPTCTWR